MIKKQKSLKILHLVRVPNPEREIVKTKEPNCICQILAPVISNENCGKCKIPVAPNEYWG